MSYEFTYRNCPNAGEDIPQLLTHFLTAAGNELGVEAKVLSADALDLLTQLPWPGNVRQLENTCRWLTVMAAGSEVLLSDLPPELLQDQSAQETGQADSWHEQLSGWADRHSLMGNPTCSGKRYRFLSPS